MFKRVASRSIFLRWCRKLKKSPTLKLLLTNLINYGIGREGGKSLFFQPDLIELYLSYKMLFKKLYNSKYFLDTAGQSRRTIGSLWEAQTKKAPPPP